MIKFALILFLTTPGRMELAPSLEYDTLAQCRLIGNIAVSWRPDWVFKCERVIYT